MEQIEHRLFSFISINWRGKPLLTYQVIVNLIASTKTKKGLTVKARIDKRVYKKGIKVTEKELKTFQIRKHEFHGEWNYTIEPRNLKPYNTKGTHWSLKLRTSEGVFQMAA